MANLTLTIDDEVLKRARLRALEQNTSVNAVVRELLEAYSGSDDALRARRAFVDLARSSTASSGVGGRSWVRDELHER